MSKFNVGDRVRCLGSTRTVVVAEPDSLDRIVTLDDKRGDYHTGPQEIYELIPKRYVVELRPPKEGERYLYFTNVERAYADYPDAAPVIIEEVTA